MNTPLGFSQVHTSLTVCNYVVSIVSGTNAIDSNAMLATPPFCIIDPYSPSNYGGKLASNARLLVDQRICVT